MTATIAQIMEKEHIALTWCPSPKLQYVNPCYTIQEHIKHLKRLTKCCDFYFTVEFFKTGGLHYHGVVHVRDKVKWYKSVLPRLKYNGYVKIKTKVNDGWVRYMAKESDTAMAIFGRNHVCNDNLDDFPEPNNEVELNVLAQLEKYS